MISAIQDAAYFIKELCLFTWNISAPAEVNIDKVDNLLPRPDGLFDVFIKQSDARKGQLGRNRSDVSIQIDTISPQSAKANGEVCRAILAIGAFGDKQHQIRYEQKRLIEFGHMPKWAQDGCRNEMKAVVTHGMRALEKAKKTKLESIDGRRSQRKENFENILGLEFLKTFADMREFSRISKRFYQTEGEKLGEKSRCTPTILSLSPDSTSALGPIAHAAFDQGAKYLLTARLLLDITEMVRVKLAEESMLELVRYHKDNPWGLAQDPKLLRMFRVRNYLDSSPEARLSDGSPKYNEEDAQRLLRCCLIVYPAELTTQASEASTHPSAGKKVGKNDIGDSKGPRNTAGKLLRNKAIEGINALIANRGYKADQGVARELFKKIKKGVTTLQQLDEGLSRGLAPQDLLQSLESEFSKTFSKAEQSIDLSRSRLVALPTEKSEQVVSRPGAFVNLSKISKADFCRLGKNDKQTVFAALVRFKSDRLSGVNWKILTEPSKIIELKLRNMRIYLTQVGEREYTVLKIGQKNTQKRDIAWLQKINF